MNDWFSWNGVKCTEYGIHVLEQPPVTLPAEDVYKRQRQRYIDEVWTELKPVNSQ